MKQIYQRGLKSATNFADQKESPSKETSLTDAVLKQHEF